MSARNYIQNDFNNVNYEMSWKDDAATESNLNPYQENGCIKNEREYQPFILNIKNTTDKIISNFDVLDGKEYINNEGFINGSLTIRGVSISSCITGIDYQQFLYETMQTPFHVGCPIIEWVVGCPLETSHDIKLSTQVVNGNQQIQTISPMLDPYQQNSTTFVLKNNFSIDTFTTLTVCVLNPLSECRIHFYPRTLINLANGLLGSSLQKKLVKVGNL
jgi:hypothetical protein